MDGFFAAGPLSDFGPCELMPGIPPPKLICIHGPRPAGLRTQLRLHGPRRPGVYGMLDEHGELIYVGKAKCLRTRLSSYFRAKSRPRRAGRIVGQTRSIVWEVCGSELAALLRELELIRRWRPRWNIQGQPLRRRQTFVCVGRAPAPHVFLSRRCVGRNLASFGPIAATSVAKEAVRRLNDLFQLRDCPSPQEMIFPDQGELFETVRPAGCLRLEIGTCLGPCTGTCTRRDYQKQVEAVRRFLAGRDDAPLVRLVEKMKAAAQAQQFERAAALRDQYTPLLWLTQKLERLRQAQEQMSFVYPIAGHDGAVVWHLIHGARVLASVPAPTDTTSATCVRTLIEDYYLKKRLSPLLDSYEHADGMVVVMNWFRKHPGERGKALSPAEALARCDAATF